MTKQKHTALPPETVAALLNTALRARKNGNPAAARSLLRALAAQEPNEPRVWLALAAVAENRDEQRHALERLIALDPQHPLAQRGLARFGAPPKAAPITQPLGDTTDFATAETLPAIPAAPPIEDQPREAQAETVAGVALPPTAPPAPTDADTLAPAPELHPTEEQEARAIRWPLYLIIGIGLLLVLVTAALVRSPNPPWAAQPSPTAALPGVVEAPIATSALATPPVLDATAQSVAPTDAPAAAPTQSPAAATAESAQPTSNAATTEPTVASPTATLAPTPEPALQPGAIITEGQWNVSLIRPEYAVTLDGAIGALQPQGRFALALVSVGNTGGAPEVIPPDLFSVVDNTGNRYLPVPGASTAYLESYGRGQRGDLSFEESIPGGGGFVSVPLIFDVPETASGLALHVGDEALGWPFSSAPGPAAPTAQSDG